MNSRLKTAIKRGLSKALPDSSKLRYLANLPRLETFRKGQSKENALFTDRYQMYDAVQDTIIGDGSITYFEFGVYEGASLKYWTQSNQHPDSRFFGFDTFTGLPESWDNFAFRYDEKTFDLDGQLPRIEDSRVTFIKGLFQETLPGFLERLHSSKPLIIHCDADLYSSTLYVLTTANSIIVPGTIIIFDEFSSILHEFRALEDYCSAYLRQYEVIAATLSPTNYYHQVAIKMI